MLDYCPEWEPSILLSTLGLLKPRVALHPFIAVCEVQALDRLVSHACFFIPLSHVTQPALRRALGISAPATRAGAAVPACGGGRR